MESNISTEEKIRAITPPLRFACFVKGKPLVASVVGWLDYRITKGYRIEFTDGYVGDFYVEAGVVQKMGKKKNHPLLFCNKGKI